MIDIVFVLLIYAVAVFLLAAGSKLIIKFVPLRLIGVPILIYSSAVFICATYWIYNILEGI